MRYRIFRKRVITVVEANLATAQKYTRISKLFTNYYQVKSKKDLILQTIPLLRKIYSDFNAQQLFISKFNKDFVKTSDFLDFLEIISK